MAKRTYYPTLTLIVSKICVFIARYNPQLREIIQEEFGAPGIAALDALDAACHLWRETIDVEINP